LTDPLKYGADSASSIDRWKEVGQKYAAAIEGRYHSHRLSVLREVLPDLNGKTVVDFGCGEGIAIRIARHLGASSVIGIDPDQALLDIAKEGGGADILTKGAVEALESIDQADCVIAANVLAYLTNDEEPEFYRQAHRILECRKGHLIVTHSNELFDLFTLNRFTASFFEKHFSVNIQSLLRFSDKPNRPTFNVRENPLSYPQKLKELGFQVERMEYINFHDTPPLLSNLDFNYVRSPEAREFRDTLKVPESERWKLMFQSSMFAVKARAI
jgi:2-polyprenyl-3-methyl-5-hydroxy-6-metoxy-1,4-benzoquinol methylase